MEGGGLFQPKADPPVAGVASYPLVPKSYTKNAMPKFLLRALISFLVIALAVSVTLAVVFYAQQSGSQSDFISLNAELTSARTQIGDLRSQVDELTQQLEAVGAESCFNASVDDRLLVVAPCSGQVVGSELVLRGMAFGLFEQTLEYEFVNVGGIVVESGFFTLQSDDPGEPVIFSTEITDKPINAGEYTLNVFGTSARDGSRTHEVSIQVKF